MAYSFPEIRSFDGLYLQANSFQVPDGAMEIASRVVIQSDQVITKMHGYYEYWRPAEGDTLEGLLCHETYDNRLLGIFTNGAGYFTDTYPFGGVFNAEGVLTTIPGDAFTGKRDTSFSNFQKNVYWTAEEGIYKLESYYDAKVRKAGVPPALGLDIGRSFSAEGVLYPNTNTAYRAVFGRRDQNGKILLGAPSDIITVSSPPPFEELAYTAAGGNITINNINAAQLQLYVGADVFISDATDTELAGFYTITYFSDVDDYLMIFDASIADGTGTLTLSLYIQPSVFIDIPSEIDDLNDEWFVQLYRTSAGATYISTPTPDFKLAAEVTLTQDDLDRKFISIVDFTQPELLGAELYTNPNTREGELQQNLRPPKANIIDNYKGYMAYADVETVQRMTLNLVAPIDHSLDVTIIFRQGVHEESYRPIGASGPYAPGYVEPVAVTATGTTSITITFPWPHTFPVGSVVQVYEITGTLPAGRYTSTARTSTTLTLACPTGTTATAMTALVVSDGVSYLFNAYGTDQTPAEKAGYFARQLVKAINLNSQFMYANYKSQFDDFPGTFAIQSKGIGQPIYMRTSAALSTPAFVQNVPSSFSSGIQLYSESDKLPNAVYFAKYDEGEAVPLLNYLLIGSANYPILAMHALRDCIVFLKKDGIYKLVGDVFDQFTVTTIDQTIAVMQGTKRPSATINNTVIAISEQGIIQVTDQSAQVVSRRIEDVIQPLFGKDLSDTFLCGHEVDRLFYVNTVNFNPGDDKVTWIYNTMNFTWTSTPDVWEWMHIGTKNEAYGSRTDTLTNKRTLWVQRRTNTRVDWTNEWVAGEVVVDPDNLKKARFTIVGGNSAVPEAGDVLLFFNIFNRIIEVETDEDDYILTFAQETSIPIDEVPTVILYKAYESIMKMAPFHAGQVGRSKHFAQMQIHLRQQMLTDLHIEFAGAYWGSSEVTPWSSLNVSTAGALGWGFSPWGLFPWGLVDGAKLVAGTEPASIIRTYVPKFAARNTFIQPTLKHKQGGQPMTIQAISWAVHGYGPNTSK